jgi:hypothetical protein
VASRLSNVEECRMKLLDAMRDAIFAETPHTLDLEAPLRRRRGHVRAELARWGAAT